MASYYHQWIGLEGLQALLPNHLSKNYYDVFFSEAVNFSEFEQEVLNRILARESRGRVGGFFFKNKRFGGIRKRIKMTLRGGVISSPAFMEVRNSVALGKIGLEPRLEFVVFYRKAGLLSGVFVAYRYLDGYIGMREVLGGEGADIELFIEKLISLMAELTGCGVFHLDFHLDNVMFCRGSGELRAVDFEYAVLFGSDLPNIEVSSRLFGFQAAFLLYHNKSLSPFVKGSFMRLLQLRFSDIVSHRNFLDEFFLVRDLCAQDDGGLGLRQHRRTILDEFSF